jgi:histidinol-phosphate phosphatase family protein
MDSVPRRRPKAVLFDRDGTLIVDEPYNAHPAKVRALPGAKQALDRLRGTGLLIGVVTNQSGIGRGWFTWADLGRVNERVTELLGPFDDWQICPHTPDDRCGCRKPREGLILAAARRLDVLPGECVVVGDRVTDVAAATAAGAEGILLVPGTGPDGACLPTPVVTDLGAAVDLVTAGPASPGRR